MFNLFATKGPLEDTGMKQFSDFFGMLHWRITRANSQSQPQKDGVWEFLGSQFKERGEGDKPKYYKVEWYPNMTSTKQQIIEVIQLHITLAGKLCTCGGDRYKSKK